MSRSIFQLKQHVLKSQSSSRVAKAERDITSTREDNAEEADSLVSQILFHLEATKMMETIWNSTRRYT